MSLTDAPHLFSFVLQPCGRPAVIRRIVRKFDVKGVLPNVSYKFTVAKLIVKSTEPCIDSCLVFLRLLYFGRRCKTSSNLLTISPKDLNTWSLKSQIAITFNVRIITDKKYNETLKVFHWDNVNLHLKSLTFSVIVILKVKLGTTSEIMYVTRNNEARSCN
jgi:hypothetical protein